MGDMEISENVAEAVAATDAPNGTAESEVTELDKYWNAVRSNPNDFTGWTYLLQYVEQENKIDEGRKAFDEFLEKYPYCFGYWKKYADLEKRNGSNDKAEEVFERGVAAIPLSVDLWLHYIAFNASLQEEEAKPAESTRKLFERALTASGTEFRSDRLWDTCISWEASQNQLRNVTALYDRVLTIPTQSYRHHYEQFLAHAKGNSPKDILSVDEFLRLRGEVVANRQKLGGGGAEFVDDDGMAPGADEAPPGLDEAAKTDDATELEFVREKLMEAREVVHQTNEEEVRKRWTLEQAIKRPYFHVKPLEKAQLKAWKEYLDFEMTSGTHERTIVLFERCLIACALYDEFWIMYAKYMEPHSRDAVRSIYRRACTVHLTHKPSTHLAWAMFEECQGNFAGAKEVLQMLESKVPGLLVTSLRLINLERRQGHLADVETLFKVKIDSADKVEERSFYAVKFAHYLAKVKGDLNAASQVLAEALEKDETNSKLYLQLIDLEYQRVPVKESAVLDLFEKAINSTLASDQRLTFSQRRLEFVEEFSSSAAKVHSAHEDHAKLTKDIKDGRKRKTSTSEAESDAKKAKTDGGAKAAAKTGAAATATATQAAAAGGYNAYAPPPPPPPPQTAAPVADASGYGAAAAQYMQYWPGYGYGAQYPQYQHAAWAQYNTMQQDYYHR